MTTNHPVVARDQWLAERKALLGREKQLTRLGDEVARERRALSWVRMDKDYVFDSADGPRALAALLSENGFGGSKLTVLEALGGPHERLRASLAAKFDLADVSSLNVVALEVEASADARILSRAPGLPDALFEHD